MCGHQSLEPSEIRRADPPSMHLLADEHAATLKRSRIGSQSNLHKSFGRKTEASYSAKHILFVTNSLVTNGSEPVCLRLLRDLLQNLSAFFRACSAGTKTFSGSGHVIVIAWPIPTFSPFSSYAAP